MTASKCIFCNETPQSVDHPGIGILLHHGPGCRNSGAHTPERYAEMNGMQQADEPNPIANFTGDVVEIASPAPDPEASDAP